MDPQLIQRLDAIEKKIEAAYTSAEKTRKYIFWTMVVTIAVVVLPLVFLPFAIGQLMSTYNDFNTLLQ